MTAKNKTIEAWVDGSTYPKNPGTSGGWGIVLKYVNVNSGIVHVLHKSGRMEGRTTNNQAETQAVIAVCQAVKKDTTIKLHTDSQYVIKCLKKVLTDGTLPVVNAAYWQSVAYLVKDKNLYILPIKVKGHDGIPDNELVDSMAYLAARKGEIVEERKEYEIEK